MLPSYKKKKETIKVSTSTARLQKAGCNHFVATSICLRRRVLLAFYRKPLFYQQPGWSAVYGAETTPSWQPSARNLRRAKRLFG